MLYQMEANKPINFIRLSNINTEVATKYVRYLVSILLTFKLCE